MNTVFKVAKPVLLILILSVFITTFGSVAVVASDVATVTVRITFRTSTKAQVSADSLNEVLDDDIGGSEDEISGGAANEKEVSSTPVATVKSEMDELTDGENVLGGSGEKSKKESDEEFTDNSFDGLIDVYYDDSV